MDFDTKKKVKLKAGDIIAFELNTGQFQFNKKYGFARVLTKTNLGDAVDVYNYFSNDLNDYENAVIAAPLFDQPVILDGHSLFWRRFEGKWGILKRDEKFEYDKKSEVKYKYGPKGLEKLIDLNGTIYENVLQKEIEQYPYYTPYSNYDILHRIKFLMEKMNSIKNNGVRGNCT
jgi:hypothetical protein